MDGDLQDDPKYIPELISEWENGNKVVLAKRITMKKNVHEPIKLIVNTSYIVKYDTKEWSALHNKISLKCFENEKDQL